MAAGTLNFARNNIQSPVSDFAKVLSSFGSDMVANARAKEAEEARLKQQEFNNRRALESDARATREEARGIAADKLVQDERLANREALKAVLNPREFKSGKLAGEQAAIEQSLAALTPVDRAQAEAELKAGYNKELSANQWIGGAKNNVNVDQGKMYDAINTAYMRKLQDPTSAEYKAKQDAEREQKKWELATAHGYRMSEIGSQNKTNKADELEALYTYANSMGVKVDPKDNVTTLKLKIGAKDKFNESVLEKTLKAEQKEQKDTEISGKSFNELGAEGFSKGLNLPLGTSVIPWEPNDSSRVTEFLNNVDIKNALRTNKIGVKDLDRMLQTQLKAGDDVESALENVGNLLTGGKTGREF